DWPGNELHRDHVSSIGRRAAGYLDKLTAIRPRPDARQLQVEAIALWVFVLAGQPPAVAFLFDRMIHTL
ncbi:MAG: hypothetical protein QOF70_5285, partial [Acetobacteraceae bacterium]|nr:hypothetical protein [Acetobacteraceae bacterium]